MTTPTSSAPRWDVLIWIPGDPTPISYVNAMKLDPKRSNFEGFHTFEEAELRVNALKTNTVFSNNFIGIVQIE